MNKTWMSSFKNNLKLITSTVVVVFLLFNTLAPISNYEIRALFVSLDMIERTPNLLEAISLSQLNDLVIKGLFSDKDFDENGNPVQNKDKGTLFDTNCEYCVSGSIKKSIEKSAYTLIKYSLLKGFNHNVIDAALLNNVSCGLFYSMLKHTSLSPIALSLHRLFITISLPRSTIDVDLLTSNVLYTTIIISPILNPILIF